MPISSEQLSQENPLGKGEVVSSILTGSTRKAREIRASGERRKLHSAVSSRTKRETGRSSGGLSVDSVHAAFRAFLKWAATYPATPEIARQTDICKQHIENARHLRYRLSPLEIRMMLKDFRKLEEMKSAVSP